LGRQVYRLALHATAILDCLLEAILFLFQCARNAANKKTHEHMTCQVNLVDEMRLEPTGRNGSGKQGNPLQNSGQDMLTLFSSARISGKISLVLAIFKEGGNRTQQHNISGDRNVCMIAAMNFHSHIVKAEI
jgi:hypothetical protein